MIRWRTILALPAAGLLLVLAADGLLPPPVMPPVSRVVEDADGLPLRIFPVEDGRWRLAADLDGIDPRFIEALLAVEDRRFYSHGGVDFQAILRAARDNLIRGRIVSGASTITMQTARLLEPRPRTFPAKAVEMLRAWQLERRYSKREILELYLTLTPYGGNLEGVRTASRAYFGKDPAALTDAEIAFLIALPQSPERRRPDLRPESARAARAAILNQLSVSGHLTIARAEEAASDPLPETRFAFPGDAWHLAHRLSRRHPGSTRITTTIDRPAQLALQRILQGAAIAGGEELQAAAMVVRLSDRAVIASVGSVSRKRPGGWMDLTQQRRSPGSTLKPLIYGLALDEGIASPGTRLADLPIRFGTYAPRNFNRTFSGELTFAEALQHSLNVPAVLLLDALGPDRMIGSLRGAGIAAAVPYTDDESDNLAVALGGLGVTLEDLAVLYSALGSKGEAGPLRFLSTDRGGREPTFRILSEESAGDILSILRQAPSAAGRLPAGLSRAAPRVAFKTGTSYGFRDAWAAGVTDTHAVVVWLGRADGASRPGATGRSDALPILFEIFDAVEPTHLPAAAAGADNRTGQPQTRALAADNRPSILFPPDGAVLYRAHQSRGYLLAARGSSPLRWYADGHPVEADASGNIVWEPSGPGFFTLTAADASGRSASATVRVR